MTAPGDGVVRALVAGEVLYRDAVRGGRQFEASAAAAMAFWTEYHELLLGELAVDPGEERRELAARLAHRFWSPRSWRAFPGVLGVLDGLRGGGVQLAVVSNFTDSLLSILAEHDILERLDVVVVSTTCGAQKPDASIFREALRRTGSDPAATVHVGDNYIADVLGARAAGIAPILVDRTRAGGSGMYDFALDAAGGEGGPRLDCPVIGDLAELLALVRPPATPPGG